MRLLGWSFGAVVAYESARQLTACGVEVDWLALVDPPFPPHWNRTRLPSRTTRRP